VGQRRLADRFDLGVRVGRGSLSVVYEAIDRTTGRRVAIKIAAGLEDLDEVRRRFDREAAALAVISSAHVVELIAAGGDEEGLPFLVLERLVGENLQEVLAEHGGLGPERVARYVAQAATALELAHGLGIVHRDLKPANLFLHDAGDGDRILKVLDFGLVVDTAGPTERMRDAFGGTPLYMAPEQVRGQLTRIGPATDIWAMAHVTLALLTGEAYWTSSTAEDVMREIESSVPARPTLRWPWLGEAFDTWFLRGTERVPERRFRSASVQAAQLAQALRGVQPPERSAGAAASFVAASTIAARTPTPSIVRLAGHRTPVIGRQVEYQDVEQLLARGAVVTLTGPAGIGKTRLAQAICETAAERFLDGTWFVSLVGGEGDAAVLSAIASALAIEPDATRSLFEHVVDSLAPRRVLIALDGVEHVPDCAHAIDQLVRACPAVSWLVTSRLPLGLPSERQYVVEPLDVPRTASVSVDEAETYAAVALFVACAREAKPMFVLDGKNAGDVVAICRAVEGSPLAIELAAAQVTTATAAQIRASLERGQGGQGGSAVRHAIMASYALLLPDQQRLLRQLALLPAGLTFDQVKRKLADLSADPMYAVIRLVQTHLATWSSDVPRRLRMLDSVRDLARELTHAAGDEAALWQFVLDHAYQVATSSAELTTEAWLALVDVEYENVRVVLERLLQTSPGDAMELAGRLAYYWYLRGAYLEGTGWLEAAIAHGADREDEALCPAGRSESGPLHLGRALLGAGRLALLTCNYERAEELLERARRIAERVDDATGEANADQLLGSVARERGHYGRAHEFHARSLEIWTRLGDGREAARACNYLAFAAWIGDYAGVPDDGVLEWWQQTKEDDLRALGDPEITVWALLNRGAILHYQGDPAARDYLGRAFADAIAARFHEGIAWSLDLIGKVSLERGEFLQARAQLSASLRVHRRLGDRWRCASVLEALAAVAVGSDRPARGAVYLGAADAIRNQINAPVPACERPMLAATEARGVDMIGSAFEAGRERGRRMPLDQTVELTRDVV